MIGAQLTPRDYFSLCSKTFESLDLESLETLARQIHTAWLDGHFVFICGNGGSGANASHFCEDLGKSTLDPEDFNNDDMPRLKVLSLTDNTPYILAWGNDEGFERIFVEQLKNFASPGDMLISISGSGNSPNVLRAVEWANSHQLTTWGVTGFDGGQLQQLANHNLHVDSDDMGLVESVHLVAFHWVLDDVYARINCVGRYESQGIRRAA
ncbi:MAG: SIS domain-containing protein [Planctomycetaceae bacterium]